MKNQDNNTLQNTGMFQSVIQRLLLTWNLLWDPRINFALKIIPVLTVGYIISPVDFLPAVLVGPLGALDDIGVLLLGLNAFFMMIPEEILQEHMVRLHISKPSATEEEIVDSTAEVVDE